MARGDFKQRVVFELEDKASGKTKRIESGFAKLQKTILSFGAITVATRAIGQLVQFLGQATQAAAAQEAVDRRLLTALQALTPAASTYAAALKEQANQLQKLGVASNEEIQSSQALIANLGVQATQLETATQAAVDLSAALGISLESAARNVGRTVGGFAGELGELVPELRELSTESLKAGAGIDLIASKFGGQAAANAKTFSASMRRLNEALADTTKSIGESFADPGAARSVQNLAIALEQANAASAGTNALTGALASLANLGRRITTNFISVGTSLAEYTGLIGAATPLTLEMAAATKALALEQEREQKALEASNRAREAATASQTAFLAAVKELGVTLENEVNAELEEQERLLIAADNQFRAGVITRQDFENIVKAVAVAERELQEELTGTNEDLQVLDQTFLQSTATVAGYNAALGRTGEALDVVRRTASAIPSSGLVARTASQQGAVDRGAFEGRALILGGTRQKIRGGSRLVRR